MDISKWTWNRRFRIRPKLRKLQLIVGGLMLESIVGLDRTWLWVALFVIITIMIEWERIFGYLDRMIGFRPEHQRIAIHYWSDGEEKSISHVHSIPGLMHRIPLKDDGLASIIEIEKGWKIHFVDMPNWEHFWLEDEERAGEGFRRYVCRYIPVGGGYKEAKFMIEEASP